MRQQVMVFYLGRCRYGSCEVTIAKRYGRTLAKHKSCIMAQLMCTVIISSHTEKVVCLAGLCKALVVCHLQENSSMPLLGSACCNV